MVWAFFMRNGRSGQGGPLRAILAVFALAAPASAAADDGASGSFEILSVQSGVMRLSITVSPGSAACEVGFGGISDCDWYAYVDVENAPGGNCQLYAPSDPSGDLGSQTNGDPQTAQEPLVTQVASGQCMLTLRYVDISGANDVLAQQPYTFPLPGGDLHRCNRDRLRDRPFPRDRVGHAERAHLPERRGVLVVRVRGRRARVHRLPGVD